MVIKNTGHDFSGKSGGAGALGVWTHGLRDIVFIEDYAEEEGEGYRGKAFKAGSGVRAFEIYEEAERYGVTLVDGECRVCFVLF